MKNRPTDSPSGEKRTVVPARRDTLRRLLARSRFQESLSLSPNRAVRASTIAGLRIGIGAAAAAFIAHAAGFALSPRTEREAT
ncbi:MAG TPA: hypothetical protein VK026_09730 [Paenalcaligenes sp.]|nr:hypothetical protein [Paenalcaligenes sp.]